MSEAPDIAGWKHAYSGKVRDLYAPTRGSDDRLLVVASDRVSAFDHVLEPGIPGKGALLTSLSSWWFAQLAGGDGGDAVPNHLTGEEAPAAVADRATVVMKLDMLPVECVVRGYITGSGWLEYQESGTVCGIALPEGLQNGDRLPQPIYTPAYKAPLGEHDENIPYERTVELVGAERAAELRETSLDIYRRADRVAAAKGLIIADTKFEFGVDGDGTLRLADEALTSDSSRYWDRAAWQNGSTPEERMASFDKQIVRDWIAANWAHAPGGGSTQRASEGASGRGEEREGAPPRLPADIISRTLARYESLLTRLTA